MSAGVGMFSGKYPVSKWHLRLDYLKNQQKGEKNQIALWVEEKVYNWDKFKHNILEDKLVVLQQGF